MPTTVFCTEHLHYNPKNVYSEVGITEFNEMLHPPSKCVQDRNKSQICMPAF